ncbi:unnamed protein product [Cuscuta campestris]|uniref:Uncharacterized protein n=1 Tax=Cuscuta campestris TaxID=132261 RepID=A0A484KWW6_9ASTE|nr:unnamed protein product [Cuscuta campestris]
MACYPTHCAHTLRFGIAPPALCSPLVAKSVISLAIIPGRTVFAALFGFAGPVCCHHAMRYLKGRLPLFIFRTFSIFLALDVRVLGGGVEVALAVIDGKVVDRLVVSAHSVGTNVFAVNKCPDVMKLDSIICTRITVKNFLSFFESFFHLFGFGEYVSKGALMVFSGCVVQDYCHAADVKNFSFNGMDDEVNGSLLFKFSFCCVNGGRCPVWRMSGDRGFSVGVQRGVCGRGGRFGLREGVEWVEGRELFSEVEGRVGWGMAMECVGAEGKEMAVDGLALVGLGIFGAWVVPGDALALLAEFGDFFIDGSEEKRLVTVLNNKFVDLWLRNINFNTNSF